MKVAEITDRAGWDRLKPLWNGLLAESASATTFLTWEWLTAWWSAYGNNGELRILTASDASGAIRGIAPLRRDTIRRYGQSFPALAFIGDGSHDSDYLDFIAVRGLEKPVIEAWLNHLEADLRRGTVLRLDEIPDTSPTLPLLRARSAENLWTEEAVACATVQLPSDWDQYLATLRPRFRTKVRSVLRNLEARAEVRFGFCEDAAELERLLPALFELHTRRWNHDGRPGVFGWERKRDFYRTLSPQLLDCGALRFSWMEWNGRLLALQYGFVYGDTYLHLQEGYEPSSEHWNVGVGLRAWSIREMLRSGLKEYDFLGGVGRHKTDWGGAVKESRRTLLGARSYRNRLLFEGPEWEVRAKESVKAVLPERILAMRAKNGASPSSLPSDDGSDSLLRRTAARCYFHLGLGAAVTPIRNRYQLLLEPNGRIPRVRLTRRRQPAGRIFCYHRVNDDRDPFFPAMSLATFEQQMQYVARRYRVVSLDGLVKHLKSDSPGTVVAVTFDDGYQDNFRNAFPILRKYDVPATIFLTTGCLDSRESPWFEQLSEAIKESSCEYLDIEADLPRRCWMRSLEERLATNDMLFGVLRQLPNDERLSQLVSVMRQLEARPSASRADVMLTWDQVREMSRAQIDFGGHTVTHPFLSRLPPAGMQWEVGECKRRIEAELQTPVRHFAYPNGRAEDFATATKEAVIAAGYEAAVTTVWGLNDVSTDRLELRRSRPWEDDEALFAFKMDWYDLVNG